MAFRIRSLGNIIAKLDIREKILTSVPMHGFSLNFAFNNSTYASYEYIFIDLFKLLFHFCITTRVHKIQKVHIQIISKYKKKDSEESLLTFVNLLPSYSILEIQ